MSNNKKSGGGAKVTAEGQLTGSRLKSLIDGNQADAARALGWGSSRLGNYVQGTRELGIYEAKHAALVFKVHPAYLLGVVDEIDLELLRLPVDKKKHLLAILGIDIPPSPPAIAASPEAREPEPRATKSRTSTAPARRSKKRRAA